MLLLTPRTTGGFMMPSILEASEAAGAAGSDMEDAALRSFIGRSIYSPSNELFHPDNPFRRPLLNDWFTGWDKEEYSLDDLCSNGSLVANRVLLAVYEQDFVFMPRKRFEAKRDDFVQFYDRNARI